MSSVALGSPVAQLQISGLTSTTNKTYKFKIDYFTGSSQMQNLYIVISSLSQLTNYFTGSSQMQNLYIVISSLSQLTNFYTMPLNLTGNGTFIQNFVVPAGQDGFIIKLNPTSNTTGTGSILSVGQSYTVDNCSVTLVS